ncbi:MAG: hypothetical protein ACTSQG_11755 [Promethearchaeota archaeon]
MHYPKPSFSLMHQLLHRFMWSSLIHAPESLKYKLMVHHFSANGLLCCSVSCEELGCEE